MGKLLCMGLSLVFRCNPSPRGIYRTYDRLAASVHVDVLHSLAPAVGKNRQRKEKPRALLKGPGQTG